LNITKPKEVGDLWPFHEDNKQVLIGIIVAVNDWLSDAEPGREVYEGLITIDMPAGYNLIRSMRVLTDTFVIKARDAKWKAARLELLENTLTKATFRVTLGR
jgi:hypothetical protein